MKDQLSKEDEVNRVLQVILAIEELVRSKFHKATLLKEVLDPVEA